MQVTICRCSPTMRKHVCIDEMMSCKNTCLQYKAQKPLNAGRYDSGQKRCQICEIYIEWEGNRCPCCSSRLRAKPRNSEWRAKLQDETKRY